jgi:hypothetical protein
LTPIVGKGSIVLSIETHHRGTGSTPRAQSLQGQSNARIKDFDHELATTTDSLHTQFLSRMRSDC